MTLTPDTVTTWRELERRLKDGWRLEGYVEALEEGR